MTIEIDVTCSGEGFLYRKGQRVENAPDKRAEDLVKAGYARLIGTEPEPVAPRKAKRYQAPEDDLNIETR